MTTIAHSGCNEYFAARALDPGRLGGPTPGCPVIGCTSSLQTAPSQWGDMPFCSDHGIRIHPTGTKFVFYNGPTRLERRQAALRNVRVAVQYFATHMYEAPHKAENHRFCFETSEDALTWNVCAALAAPDCLSEFLEYLTGRTAKAIQLYLWGYRIEFAAAEPGYFRALEVARDVFEADVVRFRTEPDIILVVPGELIVVCEAKFTAGNKVARNIPTVDGEKPENAEDTVRRYSQSWLPAGVVASPAQPPDPFYTQLYRDVVSAVHMAAQLGVEWHVSNLISITQWRRRVRAPETADPSPFMKQMLEPQHHHRFSLRTWEDLYDRVVRPEPRLSALRDYMTYKSASMRKAFEL